MINIDDINKAIVLAKNGKYVEAETIYNDLLKNNPSEYTLMVAIGFFYMQINNYEKAKEYLIKACNLNENLSTLSALGFLEFEHKNYIDAIFYLKKSLYYGENETIYDKLILSLFYTKTYNKIANYVIKMVKLYPNSENSIANMVKFLTHTGKLHEAEKVCVEYLKKHTECSGLWFYLGYLKELIYQNDKQACECYKMALENGSKSAYLNIAISYQKQGDINNAEKNYEKMLEIFPDDIDTKASYGMFNLSQRKFSEGYDLFFQRRKSNILKEINNLWQPNDELENIVQVVSDQGYGDHIQFSRYLPLLANKVKQVLFYSAPSLKTLFEKNYSQIEFISEIEINPNIQTIRLCDLAYALNLDFNCIPTPNKYLKVQPKEITSDKLKVGLCWEAGSAGIRSMINRTIHVDCFQPIFNLENIQLYSFQYDDTFNGNEKYPQMINLAKGFNNFEDTAEALSAMDLIITVDTSVAHLAGALGIKTFLLLPYYSDWRWFNNTNTTEWYNSIEIFKQTDNTNWEQPIKEIECRLKKYSS